MELIRDLIDIPEIKTVIQLEDLRNPRLRKMILDTFVVTGEVFENLRSVLTSLSSSEGRGIFLKGHFGSGKSHFLSMLSLLLRYPESWKTIVNHEASLKPLNEELAGRRFLVAEVSLVEHRGSEFLEDIFLKQIFRELSAQLGHSFEGAESRTETFREIQKALRRLEIDGMVLLVDELSEFLRSKADGRAFNEDIRFLQYLGELSTSFPLWVVASLQEWIEETGEIRQETFNKIKDRYRVRIGLGKAHIEELVSNRLIRHLPGSEGRIREIYRSIRRFFPHFPVEESRFTRLYPVHPATIVLLDRLKPLFSEHRGVVDFIHYRLKGDPERRIDPFLDRPAQELLTPEAIFDHFIDRIREMTETQVYVERVFNTYQEEIPGIFKDPDQQRIALAAVKLLILFAISPIQVRYRVRHMAEMVLFRVTELEAGINYQFFQEILNRLAQEGSFIEVKASSQDPLENEYLIDLKADIADIVRRRIRHTVSEFFPDDGRLFEKLSRLVASPHLPLAGWMEQGEQRTSLSWQSTRRAGTLMVRQIDEISLFEIETMAKEWCRQEEDFYLIVGTTHHCERQLQHLREVLLPRIREKYPGTFLFWIPADQKDEEGWLKELLAMLVILERSRDEGGETVRRIRVYLEGTIESEKKRLNDVFTRAYFQGILLWDERRLDLSDYGYLTQEKFLQEFVQPLLDRRFPRHNRIHPYMEALAPTTLQGLLREFFATGMLEVDDRSKFGLRTVLEGILKPMGLIKKKGHQYFLHVDPGRNELAEVLIGMIGDDPSKVESIYWSLRKGDYGLLRPYFEVLLLALLFCGHLVAYQGSRRKGLEEISHMGLRGITAIGKGEILEEALREQIPEHPLIPERFRKVSLTLAYQEELWKEITALKEQEVEYLKDLLSRIQWASSFQAFRNIPWEDLRKDIEALLDQWNEVKVSFPSREGLERFLVAWEREPFLREKQTRAQQVRSFLDQAERLLSVHQYVTDPRLSVPDQKGYDTLRSLLKEVLSFFRDEEATIDPERLKHVIEKFVQLREAYAQAYCEAHDRCRSGQQYHPYERLQASRRYGFLSRLDRLEMLSVEHDRQSIDRTMRGILLTRCSRPVRDLLQTQPVCSCSFRLGETISFRPIQEIEREIDLGIGESLEALQSPVFQERILPYLNGLESVGEMEKASAIRHFLSLCALEEKDLFDRIDEALSREVIEGINEAFLGKVLVVERDLDRLYQMLVHRKYTLAQLRKILREWLREEEIQEGTFIHLLGRGGIPGDISGREGLVPFLEKGFSHLVQILKEVGESAFLRAMLSALCMEVHDLPDEKVLAFSPLFAQRKKDQALLLVRELAEAAKAIKEDDPDLFDALIHQVDEDHDYVKQLWKHLADKAPDQVFRQERLFSSLQKEAFERLLGDQNQRSRFLETERAEDPSNHPESPRFAAKKVEMVRALENCYALKKGLASVRVPEAISPGDFRKWESLYINSLSALLPMAEELTLLLQRIGAPIPPFLREDIDRLHREIDEIRRAFSDFYRSSLPAWESGDTKGPTMIEDVPLLRKGKRGLPEHTDHLYLLMDGMRWDLWLAVKERFFGKMANHFRVVKEGALWAHRPTSTPTQMPLLEGTLREAYPDLLLVDLLWKIGGIDERIHTERGGLEHLFRNVIQYLDLELAYRLKELPSRTLLLLFSDHGFVENPSYDKDDKYATSRYIHGGDSPFEVIVPWAMVLRI